MDECPGTKKTKFFVKNNKGQFAIEAILLMSVLVGAFILFSNTLREKKLISKLFAQPIGSIRNMTGYGTFKETCTGLGGSRSQQRLSNCHPNSVSRALSSDPN